MTEKTGDTGDTGDYQMHKIAVYIFTKQSLLTLSETASQFCVQIAFNYDIVAFVKAADRFATIK